MEIDANVYNLLNLLLQVMLWSLIISTPPIILTIEMYVYERYKKWKDTEIQEKEKIIVGKAKETLKHDEHIGWQKEERKKLELELELLNIRMKSRQDELGINDESNVVKPDKKEDLDSMKRVELLALCKERGHKMYSKLNKEQLIKLLRD